MMKTRNAIKALQAQSALQTRHTIVSMKVSDSDLPSKAFEPRAGEAVVTNEQGSWCGYAEAVVSRLKRCGGCFQFSLCV
jgi:hypothetical protein